MNETWAPIALLSTIQYGRGDLLQLRPLAATYNAPVRVDSVRRTGHGPKSER